MNDINESLVGNELIQPTKYQEMTQLVQVDINGTTHRDNIYNLVHNIFFRIVTLILIVTDCALIISDVSLTNKSTNQQQIFDAFSMLFAILFCIEIGLRLYAIGVDEFFINWYNCVDFVVIALSFIVNFICLIDDFENAGKIIVLARLIRAFLLIRIIRLVYTEPKNLQKGVRQAVSQNKRRYCADGFDLDLTYITPRIIGMSFPSTGSWALYRNNIRDVARFLDLKHGPDHYKIYNLCSEKKYDANYFHGRVVRFLIDDHNVPTLEQMFNFVKDVRDWLAADENNVVAIHCKGGKGRTGTMVCAWLVYNGHFDQSNEVLEYFGDRRTDLSKGNKYQGVETPSQARYIDYFTRIHRDYNGIIPEKKTCLLKSLSIEGISRVGAGDGSDIYSSIWIDRKDTFHMDFGCDKNCNIFYNEEEDILIVTPVNCPPLIGDVRIKFNCRSKKVPKAYENCAFYFWLNTFFVDSSLSIPREQLDNPHKPKTWKTYTSKFNVVLNFV